MGAIEINKFYFLLQLSFILYLIGKYAKYYKIRCFIMVFDKAGQVNGFFFNSIKIS